MEESTSAQLDRLLCKWFHIMCSAGKSVTRPMITEKAKSYDEIKITDKCAFSENSNKK